MEDRIAGHSPAEAIAGVAAPVAWRDLRDWLDLVEANGLLKHIAAPVEPDEELGAITLLATRREDAPALLFEQLAGDRSQARILCNMLGASKVMAPSSSSGSTGAAICLRRPLASTRSSQSRRSRHATGPATPAIVSAGEWPAIRSSIVAPCCQQQQPYSAGRGSQLPLRRVSPSAGTLSVHRKPARAGHRRLERSCGSGGRR